MNYILHSLIHSPLPPLTLAYPRTALRPPPPPVRHPMRVRATTSSTWWTPPATSTSWTRSPPPSASATGSASCPGPSARHWGSLSRIYSFQNDVTYILTLRCWCTLVPQRERGGGAGGKCICFHNIISQILTPQSSLCPPSNPPPFLSPSLSTTPSLSETPYLLF